jgi:hypothetical protein
MAIKHYVPLDPDARYIVRNANWDDGKVWGLDLSLQEAQRRKELIAGRLISKTPIFEVMPTDEDVVAECTRLFNLCIEEALRKASVVLPGLPSSGRDVAARPPAPLAAGSSTQETSVHTWTDDQVKAAALGAAAVAAATAGHVPPVVVTGTDGDGDDAPMTEDEMEEIEALESMSIEDLVGDDKV